MSIGIMYHHNNILPFSLKISAENMVKALDKADTSVLKYNKGQGLLGMRYTNLTLFSGQGEALITFCEDIYAVQGHLYDQVLKNLQESTPEIIKLALDALDIKVYASTDRVEIQGVIPLELPTIEQTSA
jgi:hypothetical protein